MSLLSRLKFWDRKEAAGPIPIEQPKEDLTPEQPKTFRQAEQELNRQVYEKVLGKLDKLDELDELGKINLKLDSLHQLDDINDKLDLLGVLDKKLTELAELVKQEPNAPNIQSKVEEIKLTVALQSILNIIKEKGKITTSELAELRHVSKATVSEQLGKLAELGKVRKLEKGTFEPVLSDLN